MRQCYQAPMPRVAASLGALAASAVVLALSIVVPATVEADVRDHSTVTAATAAALVQCPAAATPASSEAWAGHQTGLADVQG